MNLQTAVEILVIIFGLSITAIYISIALTMWNMWNYRKEESGNYPLPLVKTKEGLSVVDHKQAAYDAIMLNLDKCQTRDQLLSAYNMPETFKIRYGRCDKYTELYAEYVGKLYSLIE